MKITLYPPLSIHEIGQRDNQEDAIWPLHPTAEDQFFILCDGMGGHEHGEVASQTVSQAFGNWYNARATHPLNKPQIEDALAYAYAQLDQQDNGELRKMGTTLTLLYIGEEGVVAAHMGDSRIYHIRPDVGVLYLSRDHSLVFDLFQSGEITYEEMGNYAQKNIVTRAMTPGEDNRMRPDVIHITDIQPGDYFFLCSDGMLENMEDRDLLSILNSELSDDEKREQFIKISKTSQDNHSAWLIHIKDVIHGEGDDKLVNEEPTARCNALNILPPTYMNPYVLVENDEDDVVIVSKPPVQAMRWRKWIRIGLLLFTIIFALILLWAFFFKNEEKPELQRPKPMMQTPISPRFNKETTNSDISKSRNNESAGNQQPVDASRRNYSTRHIQNR